MVTNYQNGAVMADGTTVKAADAVEIQSTGNENKPKRNYKREAVYDVLDAAMRQFKRHTAKHQNTETKRDCIIANIHKRYDDELRFWLDFNKEVRLFTNYLPFIDWCKAKGHNALHVAEHLIAEGKGFKNKVFFNGFNIIEDMAYMFKGNLFVDTVEIYEKTTLKQIPQMATS